MSRRCGDEGRRRRGLVNCARNYEGNSWDSVDFRYACVRGWYGVCCSPPPSTATLYCNICGAVTNISGDGRNM
eukprot:gene11817-biopygen5342